MTHDGEHQDLVVGGPHLWESIADFVNRLGRGAAKRINS